MKYENVSALVKRVLCEMPLCYNGEKIKENGFCEQFFTEKDIICDALMAENSDNLRKYASVCEKSLENAVTEKGAVLTGAFLMALYTGIRLKCTPVLMFEKYMYLKETLPYLYYNEEKPSIYENVLIEMAKLQNRYADIKHENTGFKKPGFARIDFDKCYTHPLSELKSGEYKARGMSLLPIYIADSYERLLPRNSLSEKKARYIDSSRQVVDMLKNINIYKEDIDKQLRDVMSKAYSVYVYKEETHTEYERLYPQVRLILEYINGTQYGFELSLHEILHTKMTEEEKKELGADDKGLMGFILKHTAHFLFITMPRFLICKLYAPVLALLAIKYIFHVNIFGTAKGIMSAAGELLSFVVHHPVATIVILLLIYLAPKETHKAADEEEEETPWPTERTDGIYHDVWFETKMPRDIKGFDVNAYAMSLRNGGDTLFGHHSLDD